MGPNVITKSDVVGSDSSSSLFFFSFFFFISFVTDRPQRYHPACGHQGFFYLTPVHALRFFIAMQVQHSYNSSTNNG